MLNDNASLLLYATKGSEISSLLVSWVVVVEMGRMWGRGRRRNVNEKFVRFKMSL